MCSSLSASFHMFIFSYKSARTLKVRKPLFRVHKNTLSKVNYDITVMSPLLAEAENSLVQQKRTKNHTFQKETVHGQVNWTLLLLHRGKFSKGVYLVAARLKLWLRSTIKSLFFFTYLHLAHKICHLKSTIFKVQLIRPPKLVANNFCGAFRNCTQQFFCCCVVLQADPAAQSHPYEEFLQEQHKREEWATNRRAGVAKKLSHESSRFSNESPKKRWRAVSVVSVRIFA